MQTMDISQVVLNAEALLRSRDFAGALAMSADVETALAREDRIGFGSARCGQALRERVEAIRWAAQIGRRLTLLAQG
jgi:hypothetical protein